MTPVSSRIRTRVPPHDGEEVRCWAHHPLAPTPGSKRETFSFCFFFAITGGGGPTGSDAEGCATSSAGVGTQMRLHFLSEKGCVYVLYGSHRESRVFPRRLGYMLLVTSSRAPRGRGESLSFGF